jgi:hypothetical protein
MVKGFGIVGFVGFCGFGGLFLIWYFIDTRVHTLLTHANREGQGGEEEFMNNHLLYYTLQK